MHRKEYSELSKPEAEKRGGPVVCQVALKPFSDPDKREAFRNIIARKLEVQTGNQFSVLLGGRTTIDVQIKGVNKQTAIQFFTSHSRRQPRNMIYFGNEFDRYGNDRSVLEMSDDKRPGFIINVGRALERSDKLRDRLIEDGNGPAGTLNYLKFLVHETE
ncbi:MAG: hypothetical protein AB1489_29740 [Acidobacteriota bacterium]